MAEIEDRDWQRFDKWLWCARFLKARADCARLIGEGYARINSQATEKPHARLRVGDVVTLPLRGRVQVFEVLSLASRRGPAPEARQLYRDLSGGASVQAEPCAEADMPSYRGD